MNPLDHLGLVRKIAYPYAKTWSRGWKDISETDEYQDGILGLLDAVRDYDKKRGTVFSTFAFWRIRAAVQRGLQKRLCLKMTTDKNYRYLDKLRFTDWDESYSDEAEFPLKILAGVEDKGYEKVDAADELKQKLRCLTAEEKALLMEKFGYDYGFREMGRKRGTSGMSLSERTKKAVIKVLRANRKKVLK